MPIILTSIRSGEIELTRNESGYVGFGKRMGSIRFNVTAVQGDLGDDFTFDSTEVTFDSMEETFDFDN